MKILIVNHYDNIGGAAIAARRLFEALECQGVEVRFLTLKSQKDSSIQFIDNFYKKIINKVHFFLQVAMNRIIVKDKKNLFAFDTCFWGQDISKHYLVQWADIIHIHWFNFGFLSLKSLKKILSLNKPVFWTFHDMWALTGGCFHSRQCNGYTKKCENCPMLHFVSYLPTKIINQKQQLFKNIIPIAISTWIIDKIKKSSVFDNSQYFHIPNTINTDFFKPADKLLSKQKLGWNADKIYIGFIAFNINSPFKGGELLQNAINMLIEQNPQLAKKIVLTAIGKYNKPLHFLSQIEILKIGYVSNEQQMIDYYNAMDIFVLPSEEENLPLVIQEAMACGTPVVAFEVGGVADMIEHNVSGYLAKPKDFADLKQGIELLCNSVEKRFLIAQNARKLVEQNYSYQVIATTIIDIYSKKL